MPRQISSRIVAPLFSKATYAAMYRDGYADFAAGAAMASKSAEMKGDAVRMM
jgi:hypothetical protein